MPDDALTVRVTVTELATGREESHDLTDGVLVVTVKPSAPGDSAPTYGIERGLEPPCATCAGTGTAYPARGLDPPCPVCEGTGIVAICGVVCAAGCDGEPLACGFKKGHEGKHAWATLPTFSKVGGVPVDDAGLRRAEGALGNTSLAGSREGTTAVREHAGTIAAIVLNAYMKDAR